MAVVYFDTSVFLAILNGEPAAPKIRELLTELRRDHVRIYTSIVTVQEVSVLSFKRGQSVNDHHTRVGKLARIESITREIALTAAKFEAGIIDASGATAAPSEKHRRKWDCFHLATAVVLGARTFYALDTQYRVRAAQLGLSLHISDPVPSKPTLPFGTPAGIGVSSSQRP